MYTLFAIPNCDTVKKARIWLADHHITYQFQDYKKQGIDRVTVERWLQQKPWEELLNRSGTTWKKLAEDERPTNTEEAIDLMVAKPSVIRRPLIEADGKIIALGFNSAQYEFLFRQH